MSQDPTSSDLPAGLSSAERRALQNAGITRLEQVRRLKASDLATRYGVSPRGVEELRTALRRKGWDLADR